MAIAVDKILAEGTETYSGFGTVEGGTSAPIFAALSKKKAQTAKEIAEKTGLDVKQVMNCVGRNARKGNIGRRYVENVAYYFLLENDQTAE